MSKKKKDMLYIGVEDCAGTLGEEPGEMSVTGLHWDGLSEYWVAKEDEESSTLTREGMQIMKKLLDLDAWPLPGEILCYDVEAEEGEILSHKDYC